MHREAAEALVLMVAPLAPHIAEELWARLGHEDSLAYEPFPVADPALLVEETVTCVVQVDGKVRDRLEVPPVVSDDDLREQALASEAVQRALDGRDVRTVIVRAPRLVNVVPGMSLARAARVRRRRHRLDGYLPPDWSPSAASRWCRCRS